MKLLTRGAARRSLRGRAGHPSNQYGASRGRLVYPEVIREDRRCQDHATLRLGE